MSVNNYFNSTAAGAFQVFQSTNTKVVIKAGKKKDDRWIEVMHEMIPFGSLCAIVDAISDPRSLRQRLISLSVAGVEEISFVGKSKIKVEKCLSLSQIINRDERLGLKIFAL